MKGLIAVIENEFFLMVNAKLVKTIQESLTIIKHVKVKLVNKMVRTFYAKMEHALHALCSQDFNLMVHVDQILARLIKRYLKMDHVTPVLSILN